MGSFGSIKAANHSDSHKFYNVTMVFVCFYLTAFIINIVILNFLVAIISYSYDDVKANSEKIYRRDLAELNLECN